MIIVGLFVLGLAWGSFVNALVWRLHELETHKKLSGKQKKELSFVHGRSMCVHCGHELAWYDLLPVLSWLSLGGKCRYCKERISWQYPVVELLTASLFVLSYISWDYGFSGAGVLLFGLWLVFVVGFFALAVYDLRWMLLPNKLVFPLIVLAVVQVVLKVFIEQAPLEVITGAAVGLVTIGGLFYALFHISNGRWIGGGDVKLAFMIGLLVGSGIEALLVIFLASALGTFISLPLMKSTSLKLSSRIPFGPFLLAATCIVYLFGERLINWYTSGLL